MDVVGHERPKDDLVLEARDVRRVLGPPAAARDVIAGISLSVRRGEFVALTGASGSGKSTLLYLLGALDRPSSGRVWLQGTDLGALDDDARAALRNERLGFVFQFHFLLSEFTVLENVVLPAMRLGVLSPSEARARGTALLSRLGLGGLERRRPGQLSGGQQQRVAIARALTNDPAIILADEPTGNLDSHSAAAVFELLAGLAHEQGRTVVMVTHAPDLAARADRRLTLSDGAVIADVSLRHPPRPEEPT